MNLNTALLAGFAAVLLTGCATTKTADIPLPPVDAPAGYKWVLNEDYSDEFDGTKLNKKKWVDHYPGWEGRVPGLFVPSSVNVKDGFLQIKCTVLDPPQGETNQWTIACGAVQSKKGGAHYGYYEARLKASDITTSSTFWLKNRHFGLERPYKTTELDIHEGIGNATRWPTFATHMRSNTHLEYFTEDAEEPVNLKKGESVEMDLPVSKKFHRFGCWWVDANHMKFYLDGKFVYEIVPSTEVEATPFDLPLYLNMVCEIYTWEVLPSKEDLLDDSRNTTYYDYVRAYKLVKIGE